jgi:Ca-activated chloride channel family protein
LTRILALLILAASLVAAQEEDGVFRTESRLVLLHATVVDRHGRLVTNLAAPVFQIFEDSIEQRIKVFRREDIPVSLGIIIDNSASMKEKRQQVETAALDLVKASNRQDEVFVVNFNDEVFRDVDFTSDIKKLEAGVARIDCRGGTAVRDAIHSSLAYSRANAHRDKKALVVITDGDDNMSGTTLDELVREAQQREVLIYTIGLLNEQGRAEARRAERALNAITKATGGEAYYPKLVAEVHTIALRVAEEMRNQYILAYTPSNSKLDGAYRQIRVVVNAADKPLVRTRTGYYATPDRR